MRVRVPLCALRTVSFGCAIAALVTTCVIDASRCTGDEGPIPSPKAFAANARRAGLRVFEGRRLVLATDRPARAGDGVADLCEVFDTAFLTWCRHYDIDPGATGDWTALGCLVVDRDRFRDSGLLPDTIPAFANGYCDRNRFWLVDQSNPDYRRHLLLHEGVHAFTLTVRGIDAPTWYTEGIAEFLATHRLHDGRFEATPIPHDPADVEQLGRIEEIRRLAEAGKPPSLAGVLETPGGEHRRIADYASSWAAVAMLALHPRHADEFRRLERGPLDARLTDRLRAGRSWNETLAGRDFAAFVDDIGHGFDFERSAVDWREGPSLDSTETLDVASGRGWQNTGFSLGAGQSVAFEANGRCRIGTLGDVVIETEAEGLSLDWYRERPLGRLLLAQWVDGEGAARFDVLGEGSVGTLTAARDGPLFAKLNEPPGELSDDAGAIRVRLEPAPARAADGSANRR